MDLIPFPQPAQDGDRVGHGRLAHIDRLKTPLEGRIFLDVLTVFIEGRGADGSELPAGECRLQEIGCVHRAFGRSGPHHRMQFVDEENDLTRSLLHLVQDGL